MIRILVLVLLLSTMVVGQPVIGPWTVMEQSGDAGLDHPFLTLRNWDMADVLCQWGDTLFHAEIALSNGQMIVVPHELPAGDPGYLRDLCSTAKVDNGWAAITYDVSAERNKTVVIRELDNQISSSIIDSGRNTATLSSGSSVHTETALYSGIGEGFFASWTDNTLSWWDSFWCEYNYLQIYFVNSGDLTISPRSVYGDGIRPECLIVPITPDSTIALTWNEYHNFDLCRVANGWIWPDGWHLSSNEVADPVAFFATHAGRFFILSRSLNLWGVPFNPRLMEIFRNSPDAIRMELGSDPVASASHPDFGMAWLTQPSSGLLLTRMDTSGAITSPEGVLYWPEEDYQVTGAKLVIGDNGRVTALWSESHLTNPANSRLKVATVEWNTPLNADDSHFILQPSSLTLSAYPNPFNSEVRIQFDLPHTETMELAVYNVLGQKTASVLSGVQAAGTHTVNWKPECGTGVYFVHLRTKDSRMIEKILYVR